MTIHLGKPELAVSDPEIRSQAGVMKRKVGRAPIETTHEELAFGEEVIERP